MKVHHIGYYVPDIKNAVCTFEKLGYQVVSDCIHDVSRKVTIQFLENKMSATEHGVLVELVCPDEDCSLFSKSMKRLGAMPYHICYECEDVYTTLEDLQEKWGGVIIQQPQTAPAINGRNVAFLYDQAIGLIELLEI